MQNNEGTSFAHHPSGRGLEPADHSAARGPFGKAGGSKDSWTGLLCLLLLLMAATGCKTYSSREIRDPAPSVARLESGGGIREEADRLALPLIQSHEAFGLAIGIVTPDGNSQVFGYGSTGLQDSPAPGRDTIFEVGSLSKVFVATVLERLVMQGRLHYEDTVRSILPPDVVVDRSAGELTLYELATHTGGLPRQPRTPTQLAYFIRYLFTGDNLYSYFDRAYLYDYLRAWKLPPRRERSYVYSNIGVGLLVHLIELKTGRSIQDLLKELVCDPLGMRDTAYVLDAEQQTRLAVGHAGDQPRFMRRQTPMKPWDMGDIMRASGGLYSSANDLLIFARANLELPPSPIEDVLMATHRVRIHTTTEDVGLGWIINYFDDGRTAILYKHGMVAGYNAYLGMNTNSKVAVVVLCNTFSWNDKIGHNLVLRLAQAYKKNRSIPIETKRIAVDIIHENRKRSARRD